MTMKALIRKNRTNIAIELNTFAREKRRHEQKQRG